MPGSILGTIVRRVEDPDLLTGRGTFIDNLKLDGLLHIVFVRSTTAYANIVSVDADAARSMVGVVAVYLAGDLPLPDLAGFMPINAECVRPPLARGRVRFVGDIIGAVVATSLAVGHDAAEAVVVEYEPLPAVVDAEAALLPGAVEVLTTAPGNLAASWRGSDESNPFAGADVVVRARFENQRIGVVPMEGNVIVAAPAESVDLIVYVGTQLPHMFATEAASLLGLEARQLRVVTPHVGGSFGGKAGVISEHLVTMAAALALKRPVKFVETRRENLTAMHGRAQVQYVEAGFTSAGRITGLRCRMIGDAGAYAGYGGGLVLGPTRLMAQGPYQIPTISYTGAVAVTNTAPTGGFRGAGRPEATEMLERLIDLAADELNIDPVDLRRRNLLAPGSFPYTTVTGSCYDNGEYARSLDAAVIAAGYRDLRADQARRRAAGETVQVGIGICTYVEITGFGGSEYASVQVHTDGFVTVKVGTSGHGQGHPTVFSTLVSDRLGVPIERIRFVQSDTAAVPRGGGTGGSRSLQLGGSSIYRAAEQLFDRARSLAADLLEANPDDIVLTEDGRLGVAGSPSTGIEWAAIAETADATGAPLVQETDLVQNGATFPFGTHIAVVEVDTETGHVRLIRHVAVDDCGRIINPVIVEGQQHGGIAQGAAQALWEQFVYDADGNPLTSTLAEYAMPSAAELPSFETANTQTPTHMNPLGAKGIGESGTIGAMPAVHNAVIDAVSHLGVRHIDMPCTPERVWRAIVAAQQGDAAPVWTEPAFDFDSLPYRTDQDGLVI